MLIMLKALVLFPNLRYNELASDINDFYKLEAI